MLREDWFFTSEFIDGWDWLHAGFLAIPDLEKVESVTYEVTEVQVNGVKGNPYEVKNGTALPFEITVPRLMLNWKSYKKYLLKVIAKNKSVIEVER